MQRRLLPGGRRPAPVSIPKDGDQPQGRIHHPQALPQGQGGQEARRAHQVRRRQAVKKKKEENTTRWISRVQSFICSDFYCDIYSLTRIKITGL